jgi:hypothetical protein
MCHVAALCLWDFDANQTSVSRLMTEFPQNDTQRNSARTSQ